MVLLDKETDTIAYSLTSVTRQDVVLTKIMSLNYTQDQEQEVSFDTGGRRISKVYVHEGDPVKKGDLLVELDTDGITEQIDELEYRISKNELQLQYLDAAEKFEEQSTYNSFVYNNPNISEDDLTKYEKNHDSIVTNYRYKREDYNDELEFDKKKLSQLKNRLATSKITSRMDGIVYKVTDGLEGSTSLKDEVVMTVVDNGSGKFVLEEPDYASYFHEGDIFDLEIVYGSAAGMYEVTPVDMDLWGDTQLFEVVSGPENEGIDIGTSAYMTIELDRAQNVLSLPLGAISYADDKPYVYVLDDEDYRQIVWVETGLAGDERIEIVSGLNEGDQVVF